MGQADGRRPPSILVAKVRDQALKDNGKPCIPLVPVVTSVDGVKLVLEMTPGKFCGELAICGQ